MEEAGKEARLLKRSNSLPQPPVRARLQSLGRAWIFSYKQLSYKRRIENPTRVGRRSQVSLSATTAPPHQLSPESGWEDVGRVLRWEGDEEWELPEQVRTYGRKWMEQEPKWCRCSRDGTAYSPVVPSTLCIYSEAIQQRRASNTWLPRHQATGVWWKQHPQRQQALLFGPGLTSEVLMTAPGMGTLRQASTTRT